MAKVPSGVICGHVGTNASIPAGFTRETTLDARFVKQIPTAATNPNVQAGSGSHSHTGLAHGHSWPIHTHGFGSTTSDSTNNTATGGTANSADRGDAHTHSRTGDGGNVGSTATDGPTVWSTVSAEPAFLSVIFIRSDGTPAGIPDGALAIFNGAAPAGWSEYVNARNRVWKGAASGGDGGGTGGTGDAHAHTTGHTHAWGGTHTHELSFGVFDNVNHTSSNTGTDTVGTAGHAHSGATSGSAANPANSESGSDSVGNADMTPPWRKMLAIQNTSGAASLPLNIICLWLGPLSTVPAGWRLCDGGIPRAPATTTPNLSEGKYVRGAASSAEVGTIGGASSHTHVGVGHTHPSGDAGHTHAGAAPGPTTTNRVRSGTADTQNLMTGHPHAGSGAASDSVAIPSSNSTTPTVSTDANDTLHTTAAYIQLISLPPLAPTIETPVIGATYSSSIGLAATATDPEGDNWRSEWEYSDDGGTIWRSVLGDGTTVASGAQSGLNWDISTLTPGINYKVRVWGIDSIGVEGDKTTLGGTFIIGPSLSAIHALNNTTFFSVENDTADYFAVKD